MALDTCNILSLCSGIGGLDLGVHDALVHLGTQPRVVAYVERDPFCAAVLVARMEDTLLGVAPIWDDLTSFPGRRFSGLVDLVIAGIPCQPHSQAGKRSGVGDSRDLWPATRHLLGEVGSEFFFLENVHGIQRGLDPYLARITGDLADDGWNAEWCTLSAAAIGAPHRRVRTFLLAHRDIRRQHEFGRTSEDIGDSREEDETGDLADGQGRPAVVDPDISGLERSGPLREERPLPGPAAASESSQSQALPHPNRLLLREERRGSEPRPCSTLTRADGPHWFPPGPDELDEWGELLDRHPDLEPSVRRDPDGTAPGVDLTFKTDRLRSLGNGVVPAQASWAFRGLWERLMNEDP